MLFLSMVDGRKGDMNTISVHKESKDKYEDFSISDLALYGFRGCSVPQFIC